MIDDDNPLAQALNVAGIVARQEDSRILRFVERTDRLANLLLGHYIQTDGWLIQEGQFQQIYGWACAKSRQV